MASVDVQIPSPALNASRPTLPPLRSLCLPDIRARRTNLNVPDMDLMSPNSNNLLPPLPLDFNQSWPRARQSSISSTTSSCTSSSRAASPTEAWPTRRQSITRVVRRHHPYLPGDKYRVVLSDTYDTADAMLVLPLPAEAVDENNCPIPEKLKQYRGGKAYLIVGPLAHELRDPQNRARLRAAVHPYRLVPRAPADSCSTATPTGSAFPHRRDSTASDCTDTEVCA